MYLAPYNDLQLLIWLSDNISLLLVILRVCWMIWSTAKRGRRDGDPENRRGLFTKLWLIDWYKKHLSSYLKTPKVSCTFLGMVGLLRSEVISLAGSCGTHPSLCILDGCPPPPLPPPPVLRS